MANLKRKGAKKLHKDSCRSFSFMHATRQKENCLFETRCLTRQRVYIELLLNPIMASVLGGPSPLSLAVTTKMRSEPELLGKPRHIFLVRGDALGQVVTPNFYQICQHTGVHTMLYRSIRIYLPVYIPLSIYLFLMCIYIYSTVHNYECEVSRR